MPTPQSTPKGKERVSLGKEVKEFIAGEVCKLGLKDPQSGEYVIGRNMPQALHRLLEVFVSNVQDEYRSQLILHLLQDVRLVDLHLLPLLGAFSLPEDALQVEMALSLLKLIMVVPDTAMTKEILQLQKALKQPFAKSGKSLMDAIIKVSLNPEYGDEQVKARIFTMILTILRTLFDLPDSPYYLRQGGEDRMARNSYLLKALQKSKLIDFLMAATNDQENPLILGRKREILLLWSSIFSAIDPDQPNSAIALGGETLVRRPNRHGRFSGAVVVQLATGQEILVQSTSQLLNDDPVGQLEVQKKSSRKQPRLEYFPHHTLLSQAELQFFQSFLSVHFTSCLPGLTESFLKVTEKLKADEKLHCSVFALFSFLLAFAPEPATVQALVQPRISQRAGFLLHKWLPMGKELSIPCLHICSYLAASLDLIRLLKNSTLANSSEIEYLELAERNLCTQYDLMHGVSTFFTNIKSPTPNTLKRLVVIASSVVKGMQRYCEGKALLYVSKRRPKKRAEETESEGEEEYEDFYKELSFPDFQESFFTPVIVERLFSLLKGVRMTEREQLALADLLLSALEVRGDLMLRLRYMFFAYEALKTRVFVKELDVVLLKITSHIMDSCEHNLDYLYLLFAALKKESPTVSVKETIEEDEVEVMDVVHDETIEQVVERLLEQEEVAIGLWILDKLEQGLRPTISEDNQMGLFDEDLENDAVVKVSILADIDVRKKKMKTRLIKSFLALLGLKEVEGVWTLSVQREDVKGYLTKVEGVREMIRKASSFSSFTSSTKNIDVVVTKNDNINQNVDDDLSLLDEEDEEDDYYESETEEEDDGFVPVEGDSEWFNRLRHIQFLKKRNREQQRLFWEEETSSDQDDDNEDDVVSENDFALDFKRSKPEQEEKENSELN